MKTRQIHGLGLGEFLIFAPAKEMLKSAYFFSALFERRLFSLTRIFTTPIPAPAKKTLFRPGKHLVRHRVVDFETPDNNFSQLPTDKTKIELRPAFPRPTEEPHIPANTRPSAVRTTDDPETLRINSLPPKNKKVANEYRLQPSRPPGRLRRERL